MQLKGFSPEWTAKLVHKADPPSWTWCTFGFSLLGNWGHGHEVEDLQGETYDDRAPKKPGRKLSGLKNL